MAKHTFVVKAIFKFKWIIILRCRCSEHNDINCVKSFQIPSFFCSVFSCIWNECGYLLRKSPYSVQIQENTGQKNLVFGHFSHSDINKNPLQFLNKNLRFYLVQRIVRYQIYCLEMLLLPVVPSKNES